LEPLMEGSSIQRHRLRRVQAAFASLPDRYLGGEEGREATVQIRLSDLGRTWEVEIRSDRCKVRTSPTRKPDVVIMDVRLPDGSGVEACRAIREARPEDERWTVKAAEHYVDLASWYRDNIDGER